LRSLKEMFEDEFTYYWTGAQASIFIDTVLLDEASMIGWREVRADSPLYAYNNEQFSAIARGVYRIEGKLSINFRTMGYLEYIINKAYEQYKYNIPVFGRASAFLNQEYPIIGGHPDYKGAVMNRAYFDRLKQGLTNTEFKQVREAMRNYIWGQKDSSVTGNEFKNVRKFLTSRYFNFLIVYGNPNSDEHTVENLVNCKIIDSQKQIENDGTPIQEIFTFVGRSANSSLRGVVGDDFTSNVAPGSMYNEQLSPPRLIEYIKDLSEKMFDTNVVDKGLAFNSTIKIDKTRTIGIELVPAQGKSGQTGSDQPAGDDIETTETKETLGNNDIGRGVPVSNKTAIHTTVNAKITLPSPFVESRKKTDIIVNSVVAPQDYTIYHSRNLDDKPAGAVVSFDEVYADGLSLNPSVEENMVTIIHKTAQESHDIFKTFDPELKIFTDIYPAFKFSKSYSHRLPSDERANLSGDAQVDMAGSVDIAYATVYPGNAEIEPNETIAKFSDNTTTTDFAVEGYPSQTGKSITLELENKLIQDVGNLDTLTTDYISRGWEFAPNTVIPSAIVDNNSKNKLSILNGSSPYSYAILEYDKEIRNRSLLTAAELSTRELSYRTFRFTHIHYDDSDYETFGKAWAEDWFNDISLVTGTDTIEGVDTNYVLFEFRTRSTTNDGVIDKIYKDNNAQPIAVRFEEADNLALNFETVSEGSFKINLTPFNSWLKIIEYSTGVYYLSLIVMVPVTKVYNTNSIKTGTLKRGDAELLSLDIMVGYSEVNRYINKKIADSPISDYINGQNSNSLISDAPTLVEYFLSSPNGGTMRFEHDSDSYILGAFQEKVWMPGGFYHNAYIENALGMNSTAGILSTKSTITDFNPTKKEGPVPSLYENTTDSAAMCYMLWGTGDEAIATTWGIIQNICQKDLFIDLTSNYSGIDLTDDGNYLFYLVFKPHYYNFHIPVKNGSSFSKIADYQVDNPYDYPIAFFPLSKSSQFVDRYHLNSTVFVDKNTDVKFDMNGNVKTVKGQNLDIIVVNNATSENIANDKKSAYLAITFRKDIKDEDGADITVRYAENIDTIYETTFLSYIPVNGSLRTPEPNVLMPTKSNNPTITDDAEEPPNRLNIHANGFPYFNTFKLGKLYNRLLPSHDFDTDIGNGYRMLIIASQNRYFKYIVGSDNAFNVSYCDLVTVYNEITGKWDDITEVITLKPNGFEMQEYLEAKYRDSVDTTFFMPILVKTSTDLSDKTIRFRIVNGERESIIRNPETGVLLDRFYAFTVNNNIINPAGADLPTESVFLSGDFTVTLNARVMASQLEKNFSIVERLRALTIDEVTEIIWEAMRNAMREQIGTEYSNISIINDGTKYPYVKVRVRRK